MSKIMSKLEKASARTLLGLILSVLFLAGCANTVAYREPIIQFQQASTVVIEGARIEYGIANQRERDAEIDRLVSNQKEITLKDLNNKDLRVLSSDDLAARMATLDALSKHGQLLLALASSDAPVRARDAANSLDDAIVSLSTSLGKLPSGEFRNNIEGFVIIAAEVTRLSLEVKISQALDKAITLSENNILAIIRLLQVDMSALYERQRNILGAARVLAITEYNTALKEPTPDPGKLKNLASKIKQAEAAWDNLPLLLGSGPGLDAMSQAHQKLANYAKSSKTPQDFAELVDATDAFANRAGIIADAIKIIRESKE